MVEFTAESQCTAAEWCRANEILGKVVNIQSSQTFLVDAGLGYPIYARPNHIKFVAETGDVPKLTPELKRSVPVPNDGY